MNNPADLSGRSGRQAVRYHAANLSVACAVLAMSFLLRIDSHQRVFLPGLDLVLPESCLFKRIAGFDCPGCGLTRCFISLAQGSWRTAWQLNPAGILLFGLAVVQIPYRVAQIRQAVAGQPPADFGWVSSCLGWLLVTGLLAQWLARLVI